METLTVKLKTVTPMFLGGADHAAELRPPSIKGLLRFWHRAIDPDYKESEKEIFGSKDSGQGSFLIRVKKHPEPKENIWDKFNYDKFKEGSGTNTKNGVIYLGYPLDTGSNNKRKQRKFNL